MFATPACFSSFFFLCFGDHRDLHSFPTRRSSDLSELEACLKRRGEATAAFLDEQPTYRLFPPLYYYIGRAQEGLKSPAANESYKTFLVLRQNADRDPLVTDARRRSAN